MPRKVAGLFLPSVSLLLQPCQGAPNKNFELTAAAIIDEQKR